MLSEQIAKVFERYPTLTYDVTTQIFSGYLYASEKDGDRYFLKIFIADFPKSFPMVWEVGERIPLKDDRHINSDGSICFCTKAKEEIALSTKVFALCDFIKLILIPFLQNNSYFESEKRYKFGEHSHNPILATYETYEEILKIKNPIIIERTIENLIAGIKIRPNELCYCGSRLKIKRCSNHQECYKDSRKISTETLQLDLNLMRILISELLKHSKR